jgi:hypothetical protein
MSRVPSIQELKAICWKPTDHPLSNVFYRPISLRLTWVLGHTEVTANHVTLFGVLAAVVAWGLIASGDLSRMLLGVLLLQVWVLTDHMDGEVARLRKHMGKPMGGALEGVFADYAWNHLVVHPLSVGALGVGAWRLWGDAGYLWLGAAGAWASLLSMGIWLKKRMLWHQQARRDGPLAEGVETGAAGGGGFMAAVGEGLRVLSNFVEFALIAIALVAWDWANARFALVDVPWGFPVDGALGLGLVFYGLVFPVATVASIFSNMRGRITAEYAGFRRGPP